MNQELNLNKAIDTVAYLLSLNGGKMNYMKLIKLLYIADREAFKNWNEPIVGDTYISMKNGPVLSRILDYINSNELFNELKIWREHFSEPKNYEISTITEENYNKLSDREMQLLNEIDTKFKQFDEFRLALWCHKHIPEWQNPIKQQVKRLPLPLEDMLKEIGKNDEEIEHIKNEIQYDKHFDKIFGL